ncbi:MAG: SpoIIE family protein phosphatase [Bacteroidales bacterium]|jgi:ligand-binding sensor domain-containing protein/serine phosphatase RsbU (regulator of sigma subunit)|nr:SpoIIE family protein phosphatase [Bacteroidales bacterium]
MSKINKYCTSLLLFTVISLPLASQTYNFKKFGIEEGLSHPFVYTINTDANGFLWVGTGEGLCKYNGFEFIASVADDTLADGFVTSSYKDSNGNLWFGHNSGEITLFNGSEFNKIKTGKFAKSTITDICGDNAGNVYLTTQNDGFLTIDKNYKIDTFKTQFASKLLYSVRYVGKNKILLGLNDGLYLYKLEENTISLQFKFDEIPWTTVTTINSSKQKDAYWIGTEDEGFYYLKQNNEEFDSYKIEKISENYNLGYENVQSIIEYNENNLWISTFGNGIFKLVNDSNSNAKYKKVVNYTTDNGLTNNFVKQIYQDWENNIWIATYGSGLAFSVDEAFTFRYNDINELKGNISAITQIDSILWLGSENYLVKINKNTEEKTIYSNKQGLPKDKISALYYDEKKYLLIATEKSGVYKLDVNKNNSRIIPFYKASNSLGNQINCINGNGNKIWIGSKNGVLEYNVETKEKHLYNTSTGLPHNDIKYIYVDSKNRPWIATKSNSVFVLNDTMKYSIAGNVPLEFTSITEDINGNIWAATYGFGVFKFAKDTLKYFSSDKGLKSNYCYSLIADKSGKVWIGHRLGLSSINVNNYDIKTFSKESGIVGDCYYNAICENDDEVIYWGTTDGVISYNHSLDKKNKLAPKVNIEAMYFSDNKIDINKPIILASDIYKLEIDIIGLSYSDPKGVTYKYKLEGYDLEWSDITTKREIVYPRIEDGEYSFMFTACNADGVCTQKPLVYNIKIKPPIWKTWWFITTSLVLVLGLIFFYIKYREKQQKELQEYLENELKKRTKEVTEKNDLLEIRNKNITDSINYALRIQQSILPSVYTLDSFFSGSFVFYKPRDIVSGDFYWYNKVSDDKFLIICADSTGHGVPGAFMSMIGTTLIKDICVRKDVNSPAEVLQKLDENLQSTLNQNIDAEKAHDGMDIIVCEIDINTKYATIASAMRPVIVYKNNKLEYVKGSKCSIGGGIDDEKNFENVGVQLNDGDIIYLFTDGYPDQFGGPKGKKYKMARLKNLLANICEYQMDKQYELVANALDSWKGEADQVDDILFMGIKI